MTLLAQPIGSVPEETARVAHAAYTKGNIYMQLRDARGTIYQAQSFAHLFPHNDRPVEDMARIPSQGSHFILLKPFAAKAKTKASTA